MKKYILGTLFALCLLISPAFVSPAEAAGLTPVQVSAIISLLQTLGVDQSVINTIQTALGGTTIIPPPVVIASTHKLPPTGITSYADMRGIGVDASVAADDGEFPRQDARYARPFDYTKIANDGTFLPATATLGTGAKDWACTKDNITGLIWEVKTTSGLRSKDNTYTWYNTDPATNGGDAGFASGVWYNSGTLTAPGCNTTGRCDTEKFVADVNTAGLCGHSSSWRLPTVKELESIANFEQAGPAIDTNYFPNTRSLYYFTSTLDSIINLDAWIVDGYSGAAASQVRNVPLPVRLVWTGSPAPSVHDASCSSTNPIASNPDNVYDTTTVPGTAIDTRTSLMWQRCSEGQTWDGSTCICNQGTWDGLNGSCKGVPAPPLGEWDWSGVLKKSVSNKFAGFTDWRVPNVKELRSLVEECRPSASVRAPSINDTIFPNTLVEAYSTSSFTKMLPGDGTIDWTVGFNKGTENYSARFGGIPGLRLVRDIKIAPVSLTAPTALITINGQPSVTNADPLVPRTWGWSSTKGATYSASGNITGCENTSQNGPQQNWKPWIGGTGTASSGSTSATPGAVKYGCTIVGTYNVTNATGETTTGRATITYRHSYSSSVTCTNWTYGAWRTCSANGTQARVYSSPTPTGCTGGSPVVTQSCTPPVTPVCTGTHPEAGNGVELSNYSPVVISPSGPANTVWKYGVGSCTWSCTSPMLQDGDTGCKSLDTSAANSSPVLTLTSLSPSSGKAGTTVTITASGFLGTNSIYLNGSPVDTLNSSGGSTPTWISFVIPSNLPSCPAWDRFCTSGPVLTPGTYTVSVQNTNGTSNSLSLGVN